MPESNSRTTTPGGTGRLGETTVARIGFGVMQLERRAPNREAALAILSAAAGAGIDHFDTAAFYGDCNELIREALGARQDGVVLATKVGAARNEAGDLRTRTKARGAEAPSGGQPCRARDRPPRRGEPAPPGPHARHPRRGRPGGRYRPAAGRARSAPRRGHDRRHRVIQRIGAAARACPARRHRLRPEPLQPARARHRSRARGLSPERRRMGAVFPLGSAIPGRAKVTDDPTVQAVAAELGATPHRSVSRGCWPSTRTPC